MERVFNTGLLVPEPLKVYDWSWVNRECWFPGNSQLNRNGRDREREVTGNSNVQNPPPDVLHLSVNSRKHRFMSCCSPRYIFKVKAQTRLPMFDDVISWRLAGISICVHPHACWLKHPSHVSLWSTDVYVRPPSSLSFLSPNDLESHTLSVSVCKLL